MTGQPPPHAHRGVCVDFSDVSGRVVWHAAGRRSGTRGGGFMIGHGGSGGGLGSGYCGSSHGTCGRRGRNSDSMSGSGGDLGRVGGGSMGFFGSGMCPLTQ